MADITVTRSRAPGGNEPMAIVTAETDPAHDFVDGYMPAHVLAEYTVVDSGRIILHADEDIADFLRVARESGFTCEEEGA